ncbi:MAG: ArsB/NhaD family transporter [Deltaproteobacteria bacterium]|nr:ArsB/NhaD family transporter [Deltaproteobacteria bacterium]
MLDNSHMLLAALVFAGVYAVLVLEKFNRAVVSLLGACVLIFLGVLNQEQAIHGVDFNTIGLLIGMMLIVAISQKTGMFQYLAIKSAKAVQGEPWRVLVMLSVVTAVLSALLDNVTTVLLIVPVTLVITDQLKLNPYPFLFTQIFASNIGGTATLIGDPPNIMIGSAVGLTFMDFVINVAPVIPIIIFATLLPLKFIYGRHMKVSDEDKKRIMEFKEEEAITDSKLLKKCLFVLGIVILGFFFHGLLHLESATIALFGAAILLMITNINVHEVFGQVEWGTIFFFTGLFIVVKGLVETGIIKLLAENMVHLTGGNLADTALLILWVSAIASAIVDNIPFVATMIPMIKEMGAEMGGADKILPLWWALSLGACLGGNGTIIGAFANVIVAGFSERAGYPIRFFKFMALAFPLMLISIVISTVYIWLRYL